MAEGTDDPRQRLKDYAEKHGLRWKGAVSRDGEFWRARLIFSDQNAIYHGTGFSQDEAIERAIDHAVETREAPPKPGMGPINLRDGR